MANVFRKDDVFVVASSNITIEDGFKRASNIFQGYCFIEDILYHDKLDDIVDVQVLKDNYSLNCGVFAAVYQNEETLVFTDPLGQYPVFFYAEGDTFLVSNSFWHFSMWLGAKVAINDDVFIDYISYFSVLGQETLLSKVNRLTCNQQIKIAKDSSGRETLKILDIDDMFFESPYKILLKYAAERFKKRAFALLQKVHPIVHLSGGVDSRLSCAALLTQNYHVPVFSYGDGRSQDRLIFEELCSNFGLHQKSITLFNGNIRTTNDFLQAVYSFNGLKTTNFNNWGVGKNFSYGEVTGYFSGGLLKGFGDINKVGNGGYFSYASKVSTFDEKLFRSSETRMHNECVFLLDKYDGNKLLVNQMLYLRNRSAAHFGANSVLNNRKFISIDILYDPLLISLTQKSPYSFQEINNSLVAIDLIKELHSESLAYFPYDNRVIDVAGDYTDDIKKFNNGFNCFNNVRLLHKNLPSIEVNKYYVKSDFFNSCIETEYLTSIKEFNNLDMANIFYREYPILKQGIDNNGIHRNIEYTSAAVLAASYILLTKKFACSTLG